MLQWHCPQEGTPTWHVTWVFPFTSHLMWSKTAPHLQCARSCFSMRARVVWGRTAMRQSGLSHSMIPKHSVLLLSMLPGISGIKSPMMAVCLSPSALGGCCSRQLCGKWNRAQRIHLANHPIFHMFSVLLEQNSCGSIGRVREVW